MKTLIDKAIKVCGSGKELARRLGVNQTVVSMMKNDRTISPEMAAILADIAGDNAREAAIEAMVFNAIGTKREALLAEILGHRRDFEEVPVSEQKAWGVAYGPGSMLRTESPSTAAQPFG